MVTGVRVFEAEGREDNVGTKGHGSGALRSIYGEQQVCGQWGVQHACRAQGTGKDAGNRYRLAGHRYRLADSLQTETQSGLGQVRGED